MITLCAVSFDVDRYIAPRRTAVRRVDIGAKDWTGWDVEVTDAAVTLLSPLIKAEQMPDALGDRVAVTQIGPTRLLSTIPLHLCVLTYALTDGALPVATAPLVVSPPPSPQSAVAAPSSPAVDVPPPTRRRILPPGASPDVAPPPSRINVADTGQPLQQAAPREALRVEDR